MLFLSYTKAVEMKPRFFHVPFAANVDNKETQ
jgi:hypothetical protein